MINDEVTRESLKYAKPKSLKIKLALTPIRLKLTIIVMLMGKTFNFFKTNCPSLFNRLKNRR